MEAGSARKFLLHYADILQYEFDDCAVSGTCIVGVGRH